MRKITAVAVLAVLALTPVVATAKKPPKPGKGSTLTLAAAPNPVVYGGTTVTTDDPAMPDKLRGLLSGLGALVERYE